MASFAEAAVSTSKPWISRMAFSVSRIASSSSTSSMRRFIETPRGPVLILRLGCDASISSFGCEKKHIVRCTYRLTSAAKVTWYDNTVPRFYIENFGCRATQADGAAIERQLVQRGFVPSDTQDADVVVLNTCTVTASADQDARAAIRRIHRENPACKILVTGCYAQRAPEELATLPGVTRVIGNSHKQHVAAVAAQTYLVGSSSFVPLRSLEGSDRLLVGNIFAHTELLAA